MSNSSDNTETNNANQIASQEANQDSPQNESTKTKRWSFIQNDLEKALNSWNALEKSPAQLSPEEEQLNKLKTIIGQLKDKLQQF